MESHPNHKPDFSDVPVRVRSWGVIIAILAVSLLTPELTYISVGLLSFGCYREYARITKQRSPVALVLLLVLIGLQLYFSHADRYICFALTTFVAASLSALLFRSFNLFKLLMLAVFSIGTLSFVRNIDMETTPIAGIKNLVFLLVLTELNDIFQYLCGKFFGRTPIAPRISPRKTVEGFAGGIVLTIVLANLSGPFLLSGHSHILYSLLGFLISTVGFTGDLFMSAEKRRLHIKDTGRLIPGHGGLLDRVDSLLFITPLFYWIMLWINGTGIR